MTPQQAYYERNKEKVRARSKAWRLANMARSKEVDRNKHLVRKFGITAKEYDKMLSAQDGVCKLCEQKCTAHAHLAVDHDHTTGEIRGLLCLRCNTALGQFEDFNLFEKAKKYVNDSSFARPPNPIPSPECFEVS